MRTEDSSRNTKNPDEVGQFTRTNLSGKFIYLEHEPDMKRLMMTEMVAVFRAATVIGVRLGRDEYIPYVAHGLLWSRGTL